MISHYISGKNNFSIFPTTQGLYTMKNLLLLLALLSFALCSCARVYTTVKLRPDLTDDDTEIWEFSGVGGDAFYGIKTMKEVEEALKKEAAKKSDEEGYDCFFVLKDEAEVQRYSTSVTMTQTMKGQDKYSTDYYSSSGSKYGSSKGKSDYSYQAPVTYNLNYSIPTATWYVVFNEKDECDELKQTKWRESTFYNKDYLEYEKTRRSNDFRKKKEKASIYSDDDDNNDNDDS